MLIRTHLAYIANVKKPCYLRQKSHSSESARQLTSIATEKMTSVMANGRCNVVMTLERRNKYTLTFANQSNILRDFCSAMAESWKKLKTSSLVASFIVCSKRNRSALVRDLLSYNSLFVGQLYEDKSLALRVRDLIFFTTDLQTVNY